MDRLDVKRVQVLETLKDRQSTGLPPRLLVSELMTPVPRRIPSDTSVLEVVRMLHVKRHRHLLVIDEHNRLVGVISDRDVVRCFGPAKYPNEELLAELTAAEIMSTDLITIEPNASLQKAVVLMIDHGISCLPVIADDSLVGIVTDTDLHIALEMLLQAAQESPAAQPADSAIGSPQN